MDLAVAMLGHDAVHEVEKLHAPAALVMVSLDQPGGHLKRRKEWWRRAACSHAESP